MVTQSGDVVDDGLRVVGQSRMGLLGDGANQRICGFRFKESVNITANLFALLLEFHNAFERLEH